MIGSGVHVAHTVCVYEIEVSNSYRRVQVLSFDLNPWCLAKANNLCATTASPP